MFQNPRTKDKAPRIKVFVTKTLKFRAKVKEPGKPAYEVTVGGIAWRDGKGSKHYSTILKMVDTTVERLIVEQSRVHSEKQKPTQSSGPPYSINPPSLEER